MFLFLCFIKSPYCNKDNNKKTLKVNKNIKTSIAQRSLVLWNRYNRNLIVLRDWESEETVKNVGEREWEREKREKREKN